MVRFHIQPDSEIPASKQLFELIQFAIASRQFPPGHRLPSTRQLAGIVGLHRNTIGKIYRQLEEIGLVESLAGSGIYVKAQGHEGGTQRPSPLLAEFPEGIQSVAKDSIDELLASGCTLEQVRDLFASEIDWRLRCRECLIVTVPRRDLGAGELIVSELATALESIPIQLVPMEDLATVLEELDAATVVASRYYVGEAEAIAATKRARVIPVYIKDYSEELEIVKGLPANGRLGIVSPSVGILEPAERIAHSLRGDDLLIVTSSLEDSAKLRALVRTSHTIICLGNRDSCDRVQRAIEAAREDTIRPPRLICSETYIGERSIELLRRELGLGKANSPVSEE